MKSFLVSNALYWVDEFHIDALRVDAVASMLYLDYSREDGEWVPNSYGGNENLEAIDFLRDVNRHLYERVPGVVMIAEESTSFGRRHAVRSTTAGLGFGFKWNMGWMNDSLRYLALEPIHRQYHHNELTFAMVYAYSENFVLPISHDEVVHGKGSMINKIPQDTWRQFATLRAFYSYMWAFPGKKLLFMGVRVRPAQRVRRGQQPRMVGLRPVGPPGTAADGQGPERPLHAPTPPSGSSTATLPASSGSTPTTAGRTPTPGSAPTPTAARSPR